MSSKVTMEIIVKTPWWVCWVYIPILITFTQTCRFIGIEINPDYDKIGNFIGKYMKCYDVKGNRIDKCKK